MIDNTAAKLLLGGAGRGGKSKNGGAVAIGTGTAVITIANAAATTKKGILSLDGLETKLKRTPRVQRCVDTC